MEPIEDRVRDAVAGVPGVSVLLVFGSRARGTSRPGSDLDVAVLPSRETGEQDEALRHLDQRRRASPRTQSSTCSLTCSQVASQSIPGIRSLSASSKYTRL